MKKLSHYFFKSYLDSRGEQILHIAHRHIIKLKMAAAKSLLIGIIIPVVVYLLFPFPIIALIAIGWGVVGLCALFYHFLDWYYDVWLITNVGIIAIKRNGLLDISTQRIDYHLIDDISYTIKGVLQTLLNFGDVTIDKMVANVSITLLDAPNPKKLERIINEYRNEYIAKRSIHDHDQLKSMLADMIAYSANSGKINKQK